jgi:predicted metal-dependent hydrolase
MVWAFRHIRRVLTPDNFDPAEIVIGAEQLEVLFRRHAHARRLVLRLNQEGTAAVVTVPRGVSRHRALDFVHLSAPWLATRLEQRGKNIALCPGNHIPLRGEDHEILHIPSRRGTVTVDPVAMLIHVPGELPHVRRRLLDWLKRMARADLAAASGKYAAAMGVAYRRLAIRDQRSRWGSCSANGDLSYSWRLILTPSYVLDYVAAHEVAHLKHLDHGAQFWRLVVTHCADASRAKKWLKANGNGVHRIGG